ncbi:MAG TPA: A24 family peptidase [Candidatus Elarobacter sp.]|jgi:leader peptidase (prepilin peptidase)/N-methyltransferase
MITVLTVILSAATFAALAYAGTHAARLVVADAHPFDDGPTPGRPNIIAIAGAAALAGSIVGARGAALPELAVGAVLAVALAAICYADVRCGLVPDVFTLGPLAAVLAGDLLLHQWMPLLAVAIVAGPFCLAAALSKGRGMGWGDVKLVALGAAVLGAQPALIAFAVACFAAVAVAAVRRRSAPIAFAPYLAAGVALMLAVRGAA